MVTTARIKDIKSLKDKKNRTESGLFVVEGRKMVDELCKSDFEAVEIFALKHLIDNYSSCKAKTCVITEVTEKELNRMSNMTVADGVLAVVKKKKILSASQDGLILALDNINNPGNLGTIIRSAAWFGIKTVVCNHMTVDCYNPKVLQSTMGAIFYTDIIYTVLDEFLSCRKDTVIYGTTPIGGTDIYKEDLSKSGVVIIGNETHGISKEVERYITHPLTIPSFSEGGKIESLNASVACSIILSEFMRR